MESRPHLLKYADKLQPYIIQGVVPTGKQLGSGVFGSVIELKMQGGAIAAGKKIHETMINPQNERMQRIVDKFVFECELMSKIRHPNIVTFYGLCFIDGNPSPVLVMECLDQSLEDYLERVQEKDVPFSIRISILYDVINGLIFLHTYDPVIVHCDLTARNILLTQSMQARIADLGNSRIINPGAVTRTVSQIPGTLLYMPPEVLEFKSSYDTSLDMFSFGHVALYVLGHSFPRNLLPLAYPDPQRPGRLCARTEVERRCNYFEKIERCNYFEKIEVIPFHLIELIKACLDNIPDKRPTSKQASKVLSELHHDNKDEYKLVMSHMRIDKASSHPEELSELGEYKDTGRRPSYLMDKIMEGKPCPLELYTVKWPRGNAWRKYMFQLRRKTLVYYNKMNIEGEKPKQELPLKDITSVSIITDEPRYQFMIFAEQNRRVKLWTLKSETEEERACWVEAITPSGQTASLTSSNDHESLPLPAVEYIETNVPVQDLRKQEGREQYQLLQGQAQLATYSDLGPRNKKHLDKQIVTERRKDFQQKQVPEEYQLLQGQDPPAVYSGLDQVRKKQHDGKATAAKRKAFEQYHTSNQLEKKHTQENSRDNTDMGDSKYRQRPREKSPLQNPSFNQQTGNVAHAISVLNQQPNAQSVRGQNLQLPLPGANNRNSSEVSEDQLVFLIDLLQRNLSDKLVTLHNQGAFNDPVNVQGRSRKTHIGEISSSASNKEESKPPLPVKPPIMKKKMAPVKMDRPIISDEEKRQTIVSLLRQTSPNTEAMLVTEDDSEYGMWQSNGARRPTWAKASTSISSISSSVQPGKLDALYIPLSRLREPKCIAEGEFGKVYVAKWKNLSGEFVDVALKTLKKYKDEKEKQNFEQEMAISADPKMKHPNIVQVYGLVRQENLSMIVMEYMSLGDLKTFLTENRRPLSKLVKYMLDIALGMHFISDHGLVHRDLAARNVLLGPGEICKVCDFGLLREIPEDENYYIQRSATKCPVRWMAPESLAYKKFSSASDVWSFGITQWEMFEPTATPYEDCDNLQVVANVARSMIPIIPKNCPPQIERIMKACWHTDPAKRPSFLLIARRLTEINFGVQ